MVLWTGDVMIGTPGQPFTLDFDTGSSDIWVPSAHCDDSCKVFSGWRHYDSKKSSTYQKAVAEEYNGSSQFLAEYVDGESVQGLYAQDVLRLGDFVTIDDQVFGEITKLQNFESCAIEEGVFGLAFSMDFHSFPTPLNNLATKLRHPVFALYLDATDDYPLEDDMFEVGDDDQEGGDDQTEMEEMNLNLPDENGNAMHGSKPATGASSELVFGGVNQKHYEGCLSWHDLGQFSLKDGTVFEGYWDFKLDYVKLGDSPLSASSTLALVDSGSTYVIGPIDAIGYVAEQNQAVCFNVNEQQEDPELVECTSPFGFDAASIDCEQDVILPMEFVADGVSYMLGRKELVDVIETSIGPLCLLRIQGNHDIPGWVLGDTFLNKYYSVYDFVNKRVGFAEASLDSSSICDEDVPMDLSYEGKPVPYVPKPIETPQTNTAMEESNNILPQPSATSSNPAPGPASKPYVPYDNSQSATRAGMEASQKLLVAALALVLVIMGITTMVRRRRYQREARFEEIQCTNLRLDDDTFILT